MNLASDLVAMAPGLLLAALRPGAALLFVPGLGGSVPIVVRAALAMALGALAWPVLPTDVDVSVPAIAQEAIAGALFGMAAALTIAASTAAGDLIASTMGLGFATTIDPENGAAGAVLARFTGMLGGALFLASGGHIVLVGAILDSYAALPPGVWRVSTASAAQLLELGARAMMAGAAIGLPLTAAILLVSIAMGLLARAAPQLNLFAVGLPATLLAGLALLIPALPPIAGGIVSHVHSLADGLAGLLQAR